MKIELTKVGKRYGREWIIRQIDFTFQPGGRYAITGPNGVGKSTLLRMLSGHLTPSRGQIAFSLNQQPLRVDEVYRQLSYAAPYIELIEEFTLPEAVRFHQRFKPFLDGMDAAVLLDVLALPKARHTLIRDFSSGMKQRLKLALALLSDTALVLLDEPTTNLDAQGAEWYLGLVEQYTRHRVLIVASNVPSDYQFCNQHLSILDYK
jgi:ABC-type multidrug transport system ATPase subunit